MQCQIGTHFFGHAYLTSLLLPTLKNSTPSRIVWTTSAAEAAGDVDWNNLAYVSRSLLHGSLTFFADALIAVCSAPIFLHIFHHCMALWNLFLLRALAAAYRR